MPWLQSEQEEAERQYRAVTVRSDILNRVQESRGRLEVEIRKLLHEIRHIADQALSHAKTAQAAGAPAVKAAVAKLNELEREIRAFEPVQKAQATEKENEVI